MVATAPAPDPQELRHELDCLRDQVVAKITQDFFDGVVERTVHEWLRTSHSIAQLEADLMRYGADCWAAQTGEIEKELKAFSQRVHAASRNIGSQPDLLLDGNEMADAVAESISVAIGAVGVVVAGTLAGGSGVALLAHGPLGIIIGAILGAVAFAMGKDALNSAVKDYIYAWQLPVFVKKMLSGTILSELHKSRLRFREEVNKSITDCFRPIYAAIEKQVMDLTRNSSRGPEGRPVRENKINSLRKAYADDFPKLQFSNEVFKCIVKFSDDEVRSYRRNFARMNQGDLHAKDKIHGTSPAILERYVGLDHRIYFRNDGNTPTVLLIGHKNTQEEDLGWLRKQS